MNYVKSRFSCFYKAWIRQNAPPRIPLRVKIRGTKEYAGMVELVDSGDLGAVTSGKVFLFRHPHRKIKYAGMMELADMQDLGSCAAMRWGSNPHARTTILRQSIFVDCRIFFCFSEHLSALKNLSHHDRVTSAVSLASTNSAVFSLSGWLPPYAQRNKVLSAGYQCGAYRSRTADRPVRHPR